MDIGDYSNKIFKCVEQLVIGAQNRLAVFVNSEITLLYWGIGNYINKEINTAETTGYGKQILATLSQLLTQKLGGRGVLLLFLFQQY